MAQQVSAVSFPTVRGNIYTFAGGGVVTPPSGPALGAVLNKPKGAAVDPTGNVFVVDDGSTSTSHHILKVDPAGNISAVAGDGKTASLFFKPAYTPMTNFANDKMATEVSLQELPGPIAADPLHPGNFYFVEGGNSNGTFRPGPRFVHYVNTTSQKVKVHSFDVDPGKMKTVAGNGLYEDSYATTHRAVDEGLKGPRGIAVEADGDLLIADTFNCVVKRVDANDHVTRIAGADGCGLPPENSKADEEHLGLPSDLALDSAGNIYIALPRLEPTQADSYRIRKIATDGRITTYAGTGNITTGHTEDGFPATETRLNNPSKIDIDSFGNLFIGDPLDCKVRRVDAVSKIVTTVAGNDTCLGDPGDGGPARAANLQALFDIAVDPSGRFLYLVTQSVPGPDETYGSRVRVVDVTGPLNPVVNAIDPERGPVTGGYPFRLTGDLLEKATVNFAGQNIPLTTNTKTEITGLVPRHLPPGPVPVAVTTEIGGVTVDPPKTFTYHPALTALSPPSGRLEGGDTLTIFGLGFTQIEKVRITTVPETIIDIPTPLPVDDQLTITTPPHPQGGEVRVYVTAYGLESMAVPAEANIFTYKAGLPQKQERNPNEGVSAEDLTPASFSGPGAPAGGGFGFAPVPAGAPSAVGSSASSAVSSSVPAGGSAQALDPSAAASSSAGSAAGSSVPAGAASGAPAPAARMQLGLRPVLGDANDSRPDAAPEYQMTGKEPSLPAPWFAASVGLMLLGACFGASVSSLDRPDQAVKYQPQRA